MATIKVTGEQWTAIRKQLKEEYAWKPSMLIIRDVMKRELGFTTRYHREWDPGMVNFIEHIHLDFYDDAKETFFRLKYL